MDGLELSRNDEVNMRLHKRSSLPPIFSYQPFQEKNELNYSNQFRTNRLLYFPSLGRNSTIFIRKEESNPSYNRQRELENISLDLFNRGKFQHLHSWLNTQLNNFSTTTSPILLFIYVHILIFEKQYERALDYVGLHKELDGSKGRKLVNNKEIYFVEAVLSYLSGNQDAPFKMMDAANVFMGEECDGENVTVPFNLGHASLLQSPICFSGNIPQAKKMYYKLYMKLGKGIISQSSFSYCNVVLSEIVYELGEKDKALTIQNNIPRMGPQIDLGILVPSEIIRAKIHTSNGDFARAEEALNGAYKMCKKENSPHWKRLISSQRARNYMAREDQEKVVIWVSDHTAEILKEEISEYNLFINLTLIRAFIFMNQYKEASELLAKVKDATKRITCGFGVLIDVYNLEGIIYYYLKQGFKSQEAITNSLLLGEKYGYYQSYLDMGEKFIHILEQFIKGSTSFEGANNKVFTYAKELFNQTH